MIIKLFRIKSSTKNNVTEEEIKAIIREGMEGGAIHAIEQDIMERVINLGDRKASSLMTHRSDVIYLKTSYSAAEINDIVNNEMHSVYPVFNDEMEVVGVIYLKDLFKYILQPGFEITQHIKQPQYITENISSYEVLSLFKTSNTHQAFVMDEYGQMQGLITLNDLLEALVGDVSDFYSNEFSFIVRDDGSLLVDGQYPLTEFLRKIDLENLTEVYPFNTISGLILNELRRIPRDGDTIAWLNYEIEIVDMDGARIDKVLFTKRDNSIDE